MIVITTPTGQIGHQVLNNLLAYDEPIRVIVRDASHLSAHVRRRVEIVQGSHGDLNTVTRAFAGADSVFWLIPPNFHVDNVEGYYLDFTRPACEAIKSQGVKRVVAVSTLGRGIANAGHLSAALAMDKLIKSTGVDYRALRPPFFMENLLRDSEAIKSEGIFFLASAADRTLPLCATRDIAAMAARLLLDHSWCGQDGVPLVSPDDLSPNDIAQVMSQVLQRPVRYQQISIEAYKASMLQYGASEASAQGLADMAAAQNQGFYDNEPLTTRSTTGFRQWCEEVLRPAVLGRASL